MNGEDELRLILMDEPTIGMVRAFRRLAGEGVSLSVRELGDLWARYRGFDGRTLPTHDVETGQRIRPRS